MPAAPHDLGPGFQAIEKGRAQVNGHTSHTVTQILTGTAPVTGLFSSLVFHDI